jgi:transketolase
MRRYTEARAALGAAADGFDRLGARPWTQRARAELRAAGKNVRVVSMPCVELFEEQDAAYRESVLPASVRKRLVVEASSSFGWHKYTGFDGDTVSIDRYGASAPGPLLMEKFGFTVDNVVAKAKALG